MQGVPRIHFIFAVPPDQCLILLAKIETQTAPYAFKTIRADAPFHKGRRKNSATKQEPHFRTECERVLPAQIAVAKVSVPVVSQVVLQIDLIHEARFHIIALREHNRVNNARDADRWRRHDSRRVEGGSRAAELRAHNASEGPPAPICLEFACRLTCLHLTVLVPAGVTNMGTEQAAKGVPPKQTSGNALERPVFQRAGSSIELEAPLPSQRNRYCSLSSCEAFLVEGPTKTFDPAVDPIDSRRIPGRVDPTGSCRQISRAGEIA